MKIISIICLVLLFIAYASAHGAWSGCGVPCPDGSICVKKFGVCACVSTCADVSLEMKLITEYQDNSGAWFRQYDVTVTNHLPVDITEFYIKTCNLSFRGGNSLWNAENCAPNQLTLARYQPSINKNSSYTFGFISCGQITPTLNIVAVSW